MIHLPPSMVSSLPASSQNLISAYVIGPLLDWVSPERDMETEFGIKICIRDERL